MIPEVYPNLAIGFLNGGITNSATTATLQSGHTFPATGNYMAKIDNELIQVTVVSANVATIVRGQEGSTAVSHTDGAAMYCVMTGGSMGRINDQLHNGTIITQRRRINLIDGPGINWSLTDDGTNNKVDIIAGVPATGKAALATQEGTVIAVGATQTLMSYSGGPGYISQMAINVTSSNSGDYQARELSILKIYIDGEVTPSVSATLTALHAADYGPASFSTKLIGYKLNNSDSNVGYYNYYKIPWTSSITITLTSASADSANMTVWSNINYQYGVARDWGRMAKLWNNEIRNSAVAAYATTTLASITGQGVFYGLFMRGHPSSSSYSYLEGNIKFYVDGEGTPSLNYTGTEDYFCNSNYFGAGRQLSDYVGAPLVDTGNHAFTAYRFHVHDPIPFDTSLTVTWDCGDASEGGGFSGTVDFVSGALWYTGSPS